MMLAFGLMIALVLVPGAPPAGSAADAITLRDGKVLFGQVVDSDRRGPLLVLARRAWVEANLPDHAVAWAKAEAPLAMRAAAQRRQRLISWRRERRPGPAEGDRIGPWIDGELARLEPPDAGTKTPLMLLRIARGEVKAIDRKSKRDGRLLRLGWLCNLPDVESAVRPDLARALDGRGFSPEGESAASVEALLPTQPEDEVRWLARRAATEVANDPGGRLIRYQGMLMAEPAAGEAPPAAAGLGAALGTIKELLGEAPVDPLPGKLRELAGWGKSGVVVTRMELAADLSAVAVEATLWARSGDRWAPVVARSNSVRPDALPAGAGAGLADDPQVKAAFGLIEGLGLGEVAPELKQRSLGMGAATKRALGQARAAIDLDIEALGYSLEPARAVAGPSGK